MMSGHRKIPISEHAFGGRAKLGGEAAVIVRELLIRGEFRPRVVVGEVERLLVCVEHVDHRGDQRADLSRKGRALGQALTTGL